MGVLFNLHTINIRITAMTALFSLVSILMVSHVFCFNDWADVEGEVVSENKSEKVFLQRGIQRQQMLWFSVILGGVACLIVLCVFPWRSVLLAGGVMITSVVYSHPALGGKGIPVVSSLLHFAGQVFQFLLGYSLFADIDSRGLFISIYFSTVVVAGHLTQETRDYKDDLRSKTLTNAVFFGQKVVFCSSFVLFSLSFLYLGWLSSKGVFDPSTRWFIVFYLPYVILFGKTFARGLSFQNIALLQKGYRTLFALIGSGMAGIMLFRLLADMP